MEDFVTIELAKKLEEKGFDYKCLYAYKNEQIINPEIVKAFGELSDDGYYELTKEGGGKLDWSFVYINKYQLMQYRDIRIPIEMIRAPTISQVLKWLREEKKLHIEIYMYHNCYLWEIYNTEIYDVDFTQKSEKYSEIEYASFEDAAIAGIEYVIDNLI
jgi:hypothetical protein